MDGDRDPQRNHMSEIPGRRQETKKPRGLRNAGSDQAGGYIGLLVTSQTLTQRSSEAEGTLLQQDENFHS